MSPISGNVTLFTTRPAVRLSRCHKLCYSVSRALLSFSSPLFSLFSRARARACSFFRFSVNIIPSLYLVDPVCLGQYTAITMTLGIGSENNRKQ